MSENKKFNAPIAREIWDMKYRLRDADGAPVDRDLDDTLRRVANAAASVEKGGRKNREQWAARFFDAMSDLGFIPAGRILAGAGSDRSVTLFNCFVMGPVDDDLSGIFNAVKRAARTMQSGGGIGVDFSTLRPNGALVKSIGAGASGPVSFMGVWDAMCQTIQSAGARRGAMMATLRADHPDIERFIDAKNEAGALTNFNLSVLATDAFMYAVNEDKPWDLVFDGKVVRTVRARDLWDRLMHATFGYAEPGVIFIDRINAKNNLSYCETIYATNPCGEQPLPPYGACLLGSINLAQLVTKPFTKYADISLSEMEQRVEVAVRLLDNMIDVSNYPLKRQRKEALAKRRMGIGITGLADALIMCGLGYGTQAGRTLAAKWMQTIQNAAYAASADLAAQKGCFPLYDKDAILNAPNIKRLSPTVRQKISENGLRNGCLTSIAPTGTISLLAGNVSSGIEPVWDFTYERALTKSDGTCTKQIVDDYALARFQSEHGSSAKAPDTFITAGELSPHEHLAMQAVLQPFVDSAISKTINCAQDIPFDDFKDIYLEAYRSGLKGCTTYRDSSTRGAVLTHIKKPDPAPQESKHNPQTAIVPPQAALHANAKSDPATVVYMAKPLERTNELSGFTYKLKWPQSDHAIYVTINDIDHDGRRRPFEIFINTRNLEHYSWTVALTRMISAVFRRGGDVSFVAEELKAVFDPQGGSWIDGRYVPSLLAAIGEVIDTHMRNIGFTAPDENTGQNDIAAPRVQSEGTSGTTSSAITSQNPVSSDIVSTDTGSTDTVPSVGYQPGSSFQEKAPPQDAPSGRLCPRCSAGYLARRESCWECRKCGFSRCD